MAKTLSERVADATQRLERARQDRDRAIASKEFHTGRLKGMGYKSLDEAEAAMQQAARKAEELRVTIETTLSELETYLDG